jgi:hypothetical protein
LAGKQGLTHCSCIKQVPPCRMPSHAPHRMQIHINRSCSLCCDLFRTASTVLTRQHARGWVEIERSSPVAAWADAFWNAACAAAPLLPLPLLPLSHIAARCSRLKQLCQAVYRCARARKIHCHRRRASDACRATATESSGAAYTTQARGVAEESATRTALPSSCHVQLRELTALLWPRRRGRLVGEA